MKPRLVGYYAYGTALAPINGVAAVNKGWREDWRVYIGWALYGVVL